VTITLCGVCVAGLPQPAVWDVQLELHLSHLQTEAGGPCSRLCPDQLCHADL